MIIDAFAQNILILEQTIDTNIRGFVLGQFVVLSSSVKDNYLVQRCQSFLTLHHRVTAIKTTNLHVSNALTMTQSLQPRVSILSAQNRILLNQDANLEKKFPSIKSTLSLGHNVVVSVAKGAYNTLNLSQTVSVKITKNILASNTLVMHSHGTGFLPSKYWTSFDITVELP